MYIQILAQGTIRTVFKLSRAIRGELYVDELILPIAIRVEPKIYRSLSLVNAGGQSEVSEALSMHYFDLVHGIDDILLEMEISYWIAYSMVDYICTIQGERVGISVTRAMGYPDETMFTLESAQVLLNKKLYGLIVSRNAVEDRHSFFRSILHVWAQSRRIAALLVQAYEEINLSDFGLTIVGTLSLVVTICDEASLYTNRHKLMCS